jgi:hypothetical protein
VDHQALCELPSINTIRPEIGRAAMVSIGQGCADTEKVGRAAGAGGRARPIRRRSGGRTDR